MWLSASVAWRELVWQEVHTYRCIVIECVRVYVYRYAVAVQTTTLSLLYHLSQRQASYVGMMYDCYFLYISFCICDVKKKTF